MVTGIIATLKKTKNQKGELNNGKTNQNSF